MSSSPLLLPEFLEEQPVLSFFNPSLPLTLQTTTVWFLCTLAEELTRNNCWKVKFRRAFQFNRPLLSLALSFSLKLFPPLILGCFPGSHTSAPRLYSSPPLSYHLCSESDQMHVGVSELSVPSITSSILVPKLMLSSLLYLYNPS